MGCGNGGICRTAVSSASGLDGLGTEGAENGGGGVADGVGVGGAVREGLCAHLGCVERPIKGEMREGEQRTYLVISSKRRWWAEGNGVEDLP